MAKKKKKTAELIKPRAVYFNSIEWKELKEKASREGFKNVSRLIYSKCIEHGN